MRRGLAHGEIFIQGLGTRINIYPWFWRFEIYYFGKFIRQKSCFLFHIALNLHPCSKYPTRYAERHGIRWVYTKLGYVGLSSFSEVDSIEVCRNCGGDFVFSKTEKEFYKEKGFENKPQRCSDCRKGRKHEGMSGKFGSSRRW
jgi:hypothetical protein